ncbi:hypothetical protein [Streptomyces barkulensis]|uniref:hypothetical protein n=1 Tax=Streptomyces barkulensis TaxID=1257026 RepID=UPI000C6ED1CA|nr:hypothetical protein [Streptomyces barkulensis]
MRTLLALILSWLMPAQGKRRAQTVPTQHTPAEGAHNVRTADTADEPTQRLIITRAGVGLPKPPEYLRGEDVPLIRPYLIAWERTHGIYHQEAAA